VARIFRHEYTKPLPVGAEIVSRAGKPHARYTDGRGRSHVAPLSKDGRSVVLETSKWYIEYTDASGRMRRVPGFTDKRATEAKAADLERARDREAAGIIDQQSIDLSGKLTAPIAGHVDAYDVYLLAADVSGKHRSETMRRLRTLIDGCAFKRLLDVQAEPVQRWLNDRQVDGMGARTRNMYAGSLRAFVRWCVDDRRMPADPLGTLVRADDTRDRRRERRALTEAELAALLRVAELRPLAGLGRTAVKRQHNPDGTPGPEALEWLTLDSIDAVAARAADKLRLKPAVLERLRRLGRERSVIYRTLVLTGLRRGELAQLRWSDVRLDDQQAWLTVRPSASKNGKTETLPIRADLAADLRAWQAECGEPAADARVFRVPVELVKILSRDLVTVGIARRVRAKDRKGRDCWRIDKHDADGRVIDVHALRHTTATYLAKAGVAPRTAQAIMRHSDIRLTLGTYTDLRLLDTAAAVDVLPSLPASTPAPAEAAPA
jgi:integrase